MLYLVSHTLISGIHSLQSAFLPIYVLCDATTGVHMHTLSFVYLLLTTIVAYAIYASAASTRSLIKLLAGSTLPPPFLSSFYNPRRPSSISQLDLSPPTSYTASLAHAWSTHLFFCFSSPSPPSPRSLRWLPHAPPLLPSDHSLRLRRPSRA